MESISRSSLLAKLGNFVSVHNLHSYNGNTVPNQFELRFENGRVFQSYDSLVGVYTGGKYYFTPNHEYSNTTSKYCGLWCSYGVADRRKGLKDGTFTAVVND